MYLTIDLVTSTGDKAITIKEFIATYHPSLTVPGVVAAIDSDKIDAVKPARDILVVITKKTLDYSPRGYKTRDR